MFGFLKDKLKKAVQAFTKATTEVSEEQQPEPEIKKPVEKPVLQKPAKPLAKATHTPEKPQKIEKKTETPTKETKKETPLTKPVHEVPKQKEIVKEPIPTRVIESVQVPEHKEPEKRGFFSKLLGKKEEPVIKQEAIQLEQVKPEPIKVEPKEEPSGFFGKIKAAVTTKKISREEFDTLFEELEIGLLENNAALEVVDKIKEDLWNGLSSERFSRFSPEKRVEEALKESISELFMEPFDILKEAKSKEIYVICAIGINGSGKTTTLAKLAQYFKDNKLEPVLAAADTFRAAAIHQLEEHADKIGVKIIKQQYGADAAAVAFDAIQYAKANKCRVVLIDTAGRLHSNHNLMEEMKKIVRVAKPDCTLFIGEATTGNDCVEQALQFQDAVQIDGIVLSKVDVDERGGAALSISYVTKKPIIFFGIGQTYKDLIPFEKSKIIDQLTT